MSVGLIGRKKYRWMVQVQSAAGQIFDVEIETYWSPLKEGTKQAIMAAAAGETACATRGPNNQPIPHAGLSAILLDSDLEEQLV